MTSSANTEKMLTVQIPNLFKNRVQKPLNSYKMVTVLVPFDKDTYEEKHNTYTQLKLKEDHLAVTADAYITLHGHQLQGCYNKDPPITVNHSTLQVTLWSTTVPRQSILRHLWNKLLRSVDLSTTTIIYQNQKYWKHKL